MSDTNGNDPKDRDLPGLSSHFSTTLTGLKPMRRRSRATTSTELPAAEPAEPQEAPPAEETPEPAVKPEQPISTGMESLEEVRDEAEPQLSIEISDDELSADDPLAGIELRPGLSLVDTAEIPIHRAQAAAKLAKIEAPAPPRPAPQPPQRPVVRNRPAVRHSPSPPALDDASTSARIRPVKRSSGGAGWAYVAVIILIACLIGALMMQVKDLL